MARALTKALEGVSRFFSGSGFPVFALSLMLGWELMLLGILLTPGSLDPTGFAEDFRVWCFGFDPATGSFQVSYVAAMLVPPLMLAGFVLGMWWQPVREALRAPARLALPGMCALTLVALGAGGMAAVAKPPIEGELPFPAEGLRTAHKAPGFTLVDQDGQVLSNADLEGSVVVMTGVYAHCVHTCPAVVAQLKAVLAELTEAERELVRVVAVTLDPENDTPEVLAGLAEMHGLETPEWHFLAGEPDEVNGVLDAMSLARSKDPETGIIDHVNLYLVLDRDGQLAYRFTLGETQQRWLGSALRILVAEAPELG